MGYQFASKTAMCLREECGTRVVHAEDVYRFLHMPPYAFVFDSGAHYGIASVHNG